MSVERLKLQWPGGTVTGVKEGSGDRGVLLAHGAGTNQDHPSIVSLRNGLAAGDLQVLTFNYPYTERGAKRPDRAERLLECHRSVATHFAGECSDLVLAGRSMGGRMGSYLVADGFAATALVFYAYPLHPAGKPEKLRIEQFGDIAIPMLFLQGTKDALSKMDLFEQHIEPLPNANIELLEGAGHGYRGGGWNVESITERYVEATVSWLDTIPSGTSVP